MRTVVVVLGACAEDAVAAVDGTGIELVTNPEWVTGMGSSLRAGLAPLAGRAEPQWCPWSTSRG